MPRIPEYTAPATKLRGSEQGVNAWETAGRRLGGQYREAAATLAKAAAVRGQTLADKNQWPFNLFALKQKILASQEEAREAAAGPDVAFKVSNAGSFRRDGYTGNAGFQHPNTVSMAPGFTTPVNPNSVGGGYREYSGSTSQNYYNNSLAAQANDLVSRIGDTISPSSRSASPTGGTEYVTGTPANDPRYGGTSAGFDGGGGSSMEGKSSYGTYSAPDVIQAPLGTLTEL